MVTKPISAPTVRRAVVLAVVIAVGLAFAAPAGAASKPRVEAVAVDAVELRGDGAPLAVLAEYAAGTDLAQLVQEIRDGILLPAPDQPGDSGASPSSARGPAVGRSVPLQAEDPRPTQADMFEVMLVINEGTFGGGSIFTPAHSTELRTQAAEERTDPKAPVADPQTLARAARKAEVAAGTAAFTQGILLAARNGYTPRQITDAILDIFLFPSNAPLDELDPLVPFLLAGIIGGVEPELPTVSGVLARGPKIAKSDATPKLPKSEPIEANVTLEFQGTGQITTFVNTDTPQRCTDAAARIEVTVDPSGNLSGIAKGLQTTLKNSCEDEGDLVFYASGTPPSECQEVCRYKPDKYFRGTIVFNGKAMEVDLSDTTSGFQQSTIGFRIKRKA